MAGTTKAVKRLSAGVLLLAALLPATLRSASPPVGDVMVAERIDQLVLYNKYQQHLSARDRQALPPFLPLRVLKENDVLGDGFTPCIDVESGGAAFYIVGGTEAARRSGFFHVYRNVLLLSDTVEVLRNRSVTFSPVARLNWTPVPKGERFLRFFREGNRTYVRKIGPPASYGWALLAAGRQGTDWQPLVLAPPILTALPAEVLARIRSHLGATNDLLGKLFAFFNARMGEQKATPHWELEGSDQEVICVLHDGRGESFEQSTKYLVRDLDDLLLGTGFKAFALPGRIEIRRPDETGRAG